MQNRLTPNSMNIPTQELLSWLVYNQSLTNRLESVAGDARLDVLNQRWELPDAWDRGVLKLDTAAVMHREILMWAYDTPCWYARTILPDTTFQANTALFDRLKTESLGQLIFNGTEIQRVSLTHYMISPLSPEYRWLNESMHQEKEALWMRLSEFAINNPPWPFLDVETGSLPSEGRLSFFLVEVLLPGLLRYIS